MNIIRVSFIGHRELYNQRQIETRLEEILIKLVEEKEYVEFYVGRNGDFDILVASTIKRIQKDYGKCNSCLILVLPYSVKDIEYYENYYDEIQIPVSYKTHYKHAITERNQWLIDNSDLLIAYVENDFGGAFDCVNYAIKKEKIIINLVKHEETNKTSTNIIDAYFLM